MFVLKSPATYSRYDLFILNSRFEHTEDKRIPAGVVLYMGVVYELDVSSESSNACA